MEIINTDNDNSGDLNNNNDVNSTTDLFNSTIRTLIFSIEECSLMKSNASIELNDTQYNWDYIKCLEHAPTLSKSAMIRVFVLSAMAFVSLLGNIATMWNIHKNRTSRRVTRHSWSAIYALIFHLSISDVLVTGFCIIGEAGWSYTVEWIAGDYTCKIVKLLQMFSLYLSTYVLVLIGVDRWVAVKYPMKSLNTARRCHRFLIAAYSISFILSIPQSMIFRVAKGPFIEDFYQCVTHGFYSALWQEQVYTTFTLIFMFIIPLTILIGSYLSTFRTISSSEKIFNKESTNVDKYYRRSDANRQKLIHKAKMKSMRISVVIVAAFIICWCPYYVMMIIFMFLNPDKRLSEDLQSGIFFFGMSNSLINPLIYGAFHLWPIKKRKRFQYTHTREGSTVLQRSVSTNATIHYNNNGHHNRNLNPHRKFSNTNIAEEISLMSLEKELKNLDENVNHVSTKTTIKTKFLNFKGIFNKNRPIKL